MKEENLVLEKQEIQEDSGKTPGGGNTGNKTREKPARKKWLVPVLAGVAVILCLVVAFFTVHFWSEATCTRASVCSLCGKTRGTTADHRWTAATCMDARYCGVCGRQDGAPIGHRWNEADCEHPKTCGVCGEFYGIALGHQWTEASCEEPSVCGVCGSAAGEALGHQWQDATLYAPKTCIVCEATEGENVKLATIVLGRDDEGLMILGLLSDGRAIRSVGNEFLMKLWPDVKDAALGEGYEIGLRTDGTVLAKGSNDKGQCDVGDWTDIMSVYTGDMYTLGLRADGTVAAAGRIYADCRDIYDWTDVAELCVLGSAVVGVKNDGTVVSVGFPTSIGTAIQGWTDIQTVDTYYDATCSEVVALRKDGSVAYVTNNPDRFGMVSWTGIKSVRVNGAMMVGLKQDGTVIGVGADYNAVSAQVSGWRDVVAIETLDGCVIGLKADGTLVAAGVSSTLFQAIGQWNALVNNG